jgi:uncharacterized protein
MMAAPVHLAGERLMLDPSGVMMWPAASVLVVSDLHLEKGTSYAKRGMLLPPWDTRVTLDRLSVQLRRWQPATVIALGDSFHDSAGAGRLNPTDAERIALMTQAAKFVWVQGNHDPDPPDGIGGEAVIELTIGALTFRHQGIVAADAEICGHHHPKATVPVRGTNVSRPCFVFDSRRLMMPAFGAYTGGLDVRSAAVRALFPRGGRAFLLGRERLFSFAFG